MSSLLLEYLSHGIVDEDKAISLARDGGGDLAARDGDGRTALHLAIIHNLRRCVEYLVMHDGGAVVPDALHLAVSSGAADICRLLIQHGADVMSSRSGVIPLHTACMNGSVECVSVLLSNDTVKPNSPARSRTSSGIVENRSRASSGIVENRSRASSGIVENRSRSSSKTLALSGRQINFQNTHSETPLHLAAAQGHADVIMTLLTHGADVMMKTISGETPLHYACGRGHADAAAALLTVRHLSQLMEYDINGVSALHGHVCTAKMLIDSGADVMVVTRDKSTPLHLAALYGHWRIVSLLCSRDAMLLIKCRNKSGETALHIAVEVVQLLMAHGASVNVVNSQGKTPLHIAQQLHNNSLITLLTAR